MIIKKFEEQIERFSDKIAVKERNKTITYAELNRLANRIANGINALDKKLGNPDKSNILLLFEHGADAIVGIIGALKAAKTYIPMDIGYPQKRLLYMLDHSESYVVLTNNRNYLLAEALVKQLKKEIKILNIDNMSEDISVSNIERDASRERLSYILYTSGSTGTPKGVAQNNENVLYFIEHWGRRFSITESQRITLLSSLSHDAAIPDIFGSLLNGATLYPYDIKERSNMKELSAWLQKERITIWHSVPTFYRFFTRSLDGYQQFPDLRLIVLGGEEVRTHDIIVFKSCFPFSEFANIYGQTESTVNSIWLISSEDIVSKVIIGEPIGETAILLVDENGGIIEEMGIGEIVISCKHIAIEYWKDKENSEKVFKYNNELGRLYWTGDIGQLLPDGSVSIIGRKDYQLKIRGFRVEPGEIESELLLQPSVSETVVVARADENGDNYLCAYIVANEPVTPQLLREYLSIRLPDYMIPRYFINIEKIPLTANGKIDRNALPEPLEAECQPEKYEAPTNETEEGLIAIWQELMGKEEIGRSTNFFEIGGHSLLVINMLSRIHKVFNVELQLKDVFDNPKIKELSRLILESKQTIFSVIEPVEEKEFYITSSNQKSMYIVNQFEEIGVTYNLPVVLKLEGNINPTRIEEIFQILVERHESFRTSFKMIDDELAQIIHKKVNFKVQYIDMENEDLKNISDVRKIAKKFIQPFDLDKAPLFRVALVKLSTNEHLLIMDSHHIITDGMSGEVLSREFSHLYVGETLPGLRLKYKDYSEWQRNFMGADSFKRQERYWLETFSGDIPVIDLPIDYSRPPVQSFEGNAIGFVLEKEITEQLNRMVKETGATLFMVLLAMYNVLLHKYTNQEDIIIGSVIAGRNHANLENVVGFFVQTLALRNYPTPQKTFNFFLEELKTHTLKAFENQMYPFNELVEKLKLSKDRTRNPLFDTAFVMQNTQMSSVGQSSNDIGMNATNIEYPTNTSLFDIYLQAFEIEDKISCLFQYNTKLFKRDTIELMKEHFLILIQNIIDNRMEKIQDLELATPFEKKMGMLQDVEFDL